MHGVILISHPHDTETELQAENAVYHHDIRDKLITHGPQGQYSE